MAAKATKAKPAKQRSDGWINVYTKLGDATRDKRLGARHYTNRLNEATCEDFWEGDDICARIIEEQPHEEMRMGWELVISDASASKDKPLPPDRTDRFELPEGGLGDEGAASLSHEVMERCDALNVTDTIIDARCNARAYGGAAILLGADDGQEFEEPLDETRIKSVPWLKVLRPRECWPRSYYRDSKSPKFGEVRTYSVQRDTLGGGSSGTIIVHESRIIPFYGTVVSTRQRAKNNSWGGSVLERCIEKVADFQASFQAAGILLQDFAQGVFKMVGLAQALLDGDDDLILKRAQSIDISRSVARALIIDKDEDFERKATPVSGMPELLDRLCNRLAAAARMPVTRLMGLAPAGLNATGEADTRNWFDQVAAERTRKTAPRHKRLVRIIMLAKDSPTKGRLPAQWSIKYPPLWQPTMKEQADSRQVQAQTDSEYIDRGVLLPEEVAISRFGGNEYSFETQLDEEARMVAQAADDEAHAQQAELAKTQAANPNLDPGDQPSPGLQAPTKKPGERPSKKPPADPADEAAR